MVEEAMVLANHVVASRILSDTRNAGAVAAAAGKAADTAIVCTALPSAAAAAASCVSTSTQLGTQSLGRREQQTASTGKAAAAADTDTAEPDADSSNTHKNPTVAASASPVVFGGVIRRHGNSDAQATRRVLRLIGPALAREFRAHIHLKKQQQQQRHAGADLPALPAANVALKNEQKVPSSKRAASASHIPADDRQDAAAPGSNKDAAAACLSSELEFPGLGELLSFCASRMSPQAFGVCPFLTAAAAVAAASCWSVLRGASAGSGPLVFLSEGVDAGRICPQPPRRCASKCCFCCCPEPQQNQRHQQREQQQWQQQQSGLQRAFTSAWKDAVCSVRCCPPLLPSASNAELCSLCC